MNSARKFLALALAACQSKQFEEAGIFLAQSAQSEGAKELAEELGRDMPEEVAESTDVATEVHSEETSCSEDSDLSWEDEESDEEESVSSGVRRRTTSMFRIGKIMAASMSVSSSDDSEEEDTEEDFSDSDPDFEGEVLVPASFSSVKVRAVDNA